MITFEKNLWARGIRKIAGVDEVGRGPLAGPMVVCAAILDIEKIINLHFAEDPRNNDVTYELYKEIKDSKKLTPKKREKLSEFLKKEAIRYSIVEISHRELDEIGISEATQKAFYESIKNLDTKPDHVLTDRFEIKKLTRENQTNIVRGDNLSISIAAASILAKVYRDNLMVGWSSKYPQYGFEKHKGYGTKAHLEALKTHGPCEIHRRSFKLG